MIRLVSIFFLLAIVPSILQAQSGMPHFVVSPGIKLGYASGDAGGFTMGVELSAGYWDNSTILDAYGGTFFGGVIDYDFSFSGRGKLHIGVEATLGPIGLEAGPTVVFENGRTRLATTVTGFVWLVAMPYYSSTFGGNEPSITEWGAYAKFPYRTDGGPLVNL